MARLALDYDFDWFVFVYEYGQANTDTNANDRLYLDYSGLMMQALEAGAGYRVEWNDVLYIAPTPLVLIDQQNRFHSDVAPAIRWKAGHEFHYLRGEYFEKALWQKIVSQAITAAEVMQIQDVDQRTIAISMLKPSELLKQLNARLIHIGIKGSKLYECKNFMGIGDTEYCVWMKDASTPREFIEFVPPEIGAQGDADLCQANAYGIPLEDYLLIDQEA